MSTIIQLLAVAVTIKKPSQNLNYEWLTEQGDGLNSVLEGIVDPLELINALYEALTPAIEEDEVRRTTCTCTRRSDGCIARNTAVVYASPMS